MKKQGFVTRDFLYTGRVLYHCAATWSHCNSFFKMGHSRPLFLYFRLFCNLIVQLVDKILPMKGYKPRISGVGIDCSTNWATTTAQKAALQFFILFILDTWGLFPRKELEESRNKTGYPNSIRTFEVESVNQTGKNRLRKLFSGFLVRETKWKSFEAFSKKKSGVSVTECWDEKVTKVFLN